MNVLNPIEWRVDVLATDQFDREVDVVGACRYGDKPQVWYIAALLVLNMGTLLLSIWQAWQARDLSTEFAESRHLFQAMLLIAVATFVTVPAVMATRNNPNVVLFLGSGLTLIICMSLLLLIFLPKMAFSRDEKRKSQKVLISGLSHANPTPSAPSTAGVIGTDASYGTSVEDDEDNHLSGECGERIVTTKTARELATEVRVLRAKLRRIEHQYEKDRGKWEEDQTRWSKVEADKESNPGPLFTVAENDKSVDSLDTLEVRPESAKAKEQ